MGHIGWHGSSYGYQQYDQNGSSPYEELYSHTTLMDVASSTFVTENADVAVQLISGKLKSVTRRFQSLRE